MQYELKNLEFIGQPQLIHDSSPEYWEQYINISVGIVGDTYGITKTITEKFIFLTTDIVGDAKQKGIDYANDYIITNYPEIV